MSQHICMRYYVRGRVQGVWFRASTKDQAEQLNITGWAKNLPDGNVEVMACGNKESITKLYCWLQQGPPLARVDEVTFEEVPLKLFEEFQVL